VEVGLGPGDFVFDGSQLYPREKGTPTPSNFWPMYMWPNGWMIKMPLGTKVNLGLGDVLDGVAAPPKKGTPPVFGSCLLWWPTGWMDEDATLYGSRPRPRRRPRCIRRGPSSPRKGHSSPTPLFGPCLLWPRSPISAILLSSCHI